MTTANASTTDRARAGRVCAHPLKSFFIGKGITQRRVSEIVGISQTKVNRFLNGVEVDAETECKLAALAREHGWNGKAPGQVRRLCAICRREEPREGMQVCDTCLGNGPAITPKGVDGVMRQEKERKRICTICGAEFTLYKRGSVYVKNLCRSCLTARCAAGNRKTQEAAPREFSAKIMIDFTDYPELFEQVADAASREFRTVNQQVLYLVTRGIREMGGEL